MVYESVAEMYSSVTLSFTSAPGGRMFSRVKVPKPPGIAANLNGDAFDTAGCHLGHLLSVMGMRPVF